MYFSWMNVRSASFGMDDIDSGFSENLWIELSLHRKARAEQCRPLHFKIARAISGCFNNADQRVASTRARTGLKRYAGVLEARSAKSTPARASFSISATR